MEKDFSSPSPWNNSQSNRYLWQTLQLFNLYRVILALSFVGIIYLRHTLNFFSIFDELLFQKTSVLYLISSSWFLGCSLIYKKHYNWQANFPIILDIMAIILIMHASGGVISGMGILLIVIVAAHSLLAPGNLSILSAIAAISALFFEHSTAFFWQKNVANMFPQVGLLSAVILGTSVLTNRLSIHARKTQLIIERQSQQLAASQQLNAHIISAMHAGVVVLDNQQHIRLINTAARRLLGLSSHYTIHHLLDLPLVFQQFVHDWQQGKEISPAQITSLGPEVRITFHPLGEELPAGILIFIYDLAREKRHAQDLKLASLGHLTANIAHEIRNPLGTASHAAQLLAESPALSIEDHKLVKMIKQSCDRMNKVIANVLSLSGRKPAKVQKIALVPWLEQFIQDFSQQNRESPCLTLESDQKAYCIQIDPSQLTQILVNLCENGLRYSLRATGKATLLLKVHKSHHQPLIYLDIIDQGLGIPKNAIPHLFEPFFTTEKTGSGLGLFIAKELCQMNSARLDYYPNTSQGHFRISIPLGEDNG